MKSLKALFKKKNNKSETMKGAVIHEAMFSNVYSLAQNPEEIVLRLHPTKRAAYNSILKGEATVSQNGQEIRITDVILVLNSANGNVQIKYSDLSELAPTKIINTTSITGFDDNGEPLIYEMDDNSIRVVFSSLPPKSKPAFDLDEFSKQLVSAIQCGITHDDREIFHIPKPDQNTVNAVKRFIEDYKL